MDQEYTPIISAEERAARRRQRAEARRRKQRARRRRQLCILVPCLAAAGLIIGGLRLAGSTEEAPVKAGRVFQLPAEPLGASDYPRPRADENTVQLPDTFPSRCAVLLDAQSGIILAGTAKEKPQVA